LLLHHRQKAAAAVGVIAGLVALVIAALFSGAALYVNLVEQPARLALSDQALLAQWQPSYKRGFLMQAPLAIAGFLAGFAAWWMTGRVLFVVGALCMIANWPWTLLTIRPINSVLMATAPSDAGPKSRALLTQWNNLHAVRTALGTLATLAFLIALCG
jgi:hypothetical protein